MTAIVTGQPRIYGEVHYNQVTNEISPPKQTTSNMYTCVEVYYKHGEHFVSTISSDEEMRRYCLNQLIDYDILPDRNTQHYVIAAAQYNTMMLDDLIRLVIEKGNMQVNEQLGWGLVDVVKGQNLTTY